MAGTNKNVELKLQVTDLTNNRLKEFVQDVIALRDATKALNGASDPQAKVLDRQATQLRQLSKTFGEAEQGANKLSGAMEKLAGPRSFLSSALGGAGLGSLGQLAGLAGITAAISAAGLIVGQSVRMSYEWERVTTRVASQFGIGTATPLAVNMAAMRSASFGGERYGYDAITLGQAGAGYGAASGATAFGIAGAMPGIARYARAYGLDPSTVGQLVGSYSAFSGKDFNTDASGLFGAAEEGGPLGRRLGEFIGTATNVLSSLQMGNPEGNIDVQQVGGIVSGISRLGGIYSTSQGVLATESAASALTQGGNADLKRSALMARAGLSDRDIILGINRPQNQRKIYDELLKETGGVQSPVFWSQLVGMVGQEGARMLIGAQDKSGGTDFFTNRSGAAPLEDRLKQALDTPLAKIDANIAKVKDTMIADGDKILQALGTGDMTVLLEGILAATAASAMLNGFGGARGLLGLAGRAAPFVMGGLEAAGAGSAALGAGVLAGGAAGGFGLFSGIHWLVNNGGKGDATAAFLQMVKAGMPEDEARARANLLYKNDFTYAANANDITSRNYTTPGLIAMLQRAGVSNRLDVTALNRGHHADKWHSFGLAADVGAVDGHIVNESEDPYIKAWLMRQIQTNPYIHQLGLGSAYENDAAIMAAIRRRGDITEWNEPNNHIHMGAGVSKNVSAHGVNVEIKVTPKHGPNTGNRQKGTPSNTGRR